MDNSARCPDCGAPTPAGREDCPFCDYPVDYHRANQFQRAWLVWVLLGLRVVAVLTLLMLGYFFVPRFGCHVLIGNIGG